MDLNQVKGIVEKMLEDHPETRDDDQLLSLKVWGFIEPKLRHPKTSFNAFASRFLSGKFPSTESIRRSRQKWQEEREDLRGETYNKRHKILEPEVKKQIRNW